MYMEVVNGLGKEIMKGKWEFCQGVLCLRNW